MTLLSRLNSWAQRVWFSPRARKYHQRVLRVPPQPVSQFPDATVRNKTRAVP